MSTRSPDHSINASNSTQNQTLQRLLNVTAALIHERGCRKTTLQEIMNRTGLSKGAIYHYVNSKDELFALILQQRINETNRQFLAEVDSAAKGELADPLQAITDSLFPPYPDKSHVANEIMIYLLSQRNNDKIGQLLRQVHDYTHQIAAKWIAIGQENGAIPAALDTERTASLFILVAYGLDIHQLIDPEKDTFDHRAFYYQLMQDTLHFSE